jgi:hypothetical protein
MTSGEHPSFEGVSTDHPELSPPSVRGVAADQPRGHMPPDLGQCKELG